MRKLFVICLLAMAAESAWALSVDSPNGGERWMLGSNHNVSWNQDPGPGTTTEAFLWRLDQGAGNFVAEGQMMVYSSNNGSMTWFGSMMNGSYPPAGTGYYVVLNLLEGGLVVASDISDWPFEILPDDFVKVDIRADNSDEPIQIVPGGQVISLSWTSANADSVNISYTSGTEYVYFGNLAASGMMSVFIQEPASPSGGRIYATADSEFGYKGDSVQILPSRVVVLNPQSGQAITEGDQVQVVWSFAQREMYESERIFDDYAVSVGNKYFDAPVYVGVSAKTKTESTITISANLAAYLMENHDKKGVVAADARDSFFFRVEARKLVYVNDKDGGRFTIQTVSSGDSAMFTVNVAPPPAVQPKVTGFSGPNKLKVGEAGTWKIQATAAPGTTLICFLWGRENSRVFNETWPGKFEIELSLVCSEPGVVPITFVILDEYSGLSVSMDSSVTVEQDSPAGQAKDIVISRAKEPKVDIKKKTNRSGTKYVLTVYSKVGLDIVEEQDDAGTKTSISRKPSILDLFSTNMKF